MAKISTDLGPARTLHPREDLFITGSLGSLNAEIIVACDGSGTVSLDLRGTYNLTVEVSGTVDGTNWLLIPMRAINLASVAFVAAIAGTTQGAWIGACAGYSKIRARVTAHTSGSATATLSASLGEVDWQRSGIVTSGLGTITAAAGAAATLTLASPGAGLRHYLTYVRVARIAAAALTAGAAPVLVTTTNIPGALVFSIAANAALQGDIFPIQEDFNYPIAVTAQATATTIVAPATTNVIWRITAGFYVAP